MVGSIIKALRFKPGGYSVERWVRGCAAQIVGLFGFSVLQMAPFYLKIGLDKGRVFAKCLIFDEFFFTYMSCLKVCIPIYMAKSNDLKSAFQETNGLDIGCKFEYSV